MLASEFGTGQVFWSFLWFTMFFIWIWLLIMVFSDVFRSHDLNGWTKFFWIFFIILLPYLGVFVYLIARGHKMAEHAQESAQRQDAANRAYIQSVVPAGGASAADQIAKASELKAQGLITEEEFQTLKAKALAGG